MKSIYRSSAVFLIVAAAITAVVFRYAVRDRHLVEEPHPAVESTLVAPEPGSSEDFDAQRLEAEAWTDGRPFIITWGDRDVLSDPASWSTFDDRLMGVVMSYPRDVTVADHGWGDYALWSADPMLGAWSFDWSGKASDASLHADLIVEAGCDGGSFVGNQFPRDTKAKNVMFDEVEIAGKSWQRQIRMIPHVPEGAQVMRGETVWYIDRLACKTYIVDAVYPSLKGRQRLVGMLQRLQLQ